MALTIGASPPLLRTGARRRPRRPTTSARCRATAGARTRSCRRARRALLRLVGARPDAAPRPARARAQPADEPVLLRAAGDDGARRLPPRAVDRRGHAASGSPSTPTTSAARTRRSSRPIRCARPCDARQATEVARDGGRASRPALHEGARPPGVFTRHDIHGDTVLDCDVVDRSARAPAARTIAAELAEAGFDVVVLEEGSYYQTRDFTADTSAMVRQLYRDGGATMALGNPPVMYQEGRAVGGSTVINGGMSWRTPDKILERWEREAGLDGIARATGAVLRARRAAHPRRADGRRRDRQRQPAAQEGRRREGLEDHRQPAQPGALRRLEPLRVRLPDRRQAERARQLHPARAALRRARLRRRPRRPHHAPRQARDRRDRHVRRRRHAATGSPCARSSSSSACGAIHTPALLARSGFRSPSGQLGHNLSMHPNVKVVAIFDEDVTRLEGRAPGVPGPRVPGPGPRVRRGQHAAERSSRCRSRTAAPRSAS